MARTAKSGEIRQQWEELAKRWQAKADAEERHAESLDVVAAAQATTAPSFRPAAVEERSDGKPEPDSNPVVAPALPDLASSPIAPDKEPQPEALDEVLTLRFWTISGRDLSRQFAQNNLKEAALTVGSYVLCSS